MDPTSFLDEAKAARRGLAGLAWEDTVVRCICQLSGVLSGLSEMYELLRDRTEGRHLTLALFHEVYPSFPVKLGASKVPYAHDILEIRRFFTAPTKVPIWKAFTESRDLCESNYGNVGTYGLVFPLNGVTKYMIIHDCDFDPARQGIVLSFALRPHRTSDMRRYYIERLDTFLAALAWRPPS